MKVYLAGPYGSRDKLRRYASELKDAEIECMSSWLEETHEINAGTQGAAIALADEVVAAHAETDLIDINLSDVLVLFTSSYVGVEGGGGRHVETGYAIARSMPVIVVGEPENVFHRLPEVHLVAHWPHALAVLKRWAA